MSWVDPETSKPAVERSALYQSIWPLCLFTATKPLLRECLHELLEALEVSVCQRVLECIRQWPFQALFPARTAVVQVRAASGQFSGWVHLHAFRAAHQAHQGALRQDSSAAHACALGNVLGLFCRFARHLLNPMVVQGDFLISGGRTTLLPSLRHHVYASSWQSPY